LDKYFLLYSHYIFWNVMVLLLEYVFSVLFPPLMEVNETRNCLVTDILLNIRKSSEWIRKR